MDCKLKFRAQFGGFGFGYRAIGGGTEKRHLSSYKYSVRIKTISPSNILTVIEFVKRVIQLPGESPDTVKINLAILTVVLIFVPQKEVNDKYARHYK